MTVRKIASGNVNTTLDKFVGEDGILFYDHNTGELRISDGHTPGGRPLDLTNEITRGTLIQSDLPPYPYSTSTLWYDTLGGRTYVYFEETWVDASPSSTPAVVSWELTSSTGVVSVNSNGTLLLGNPSLSTTTNYASETILRIDTDINDFQQISIQNHNDGHNASSDIIFYTNNSNEYNNHYMDLGIVSSNYNQASWDILSPGSGYLFTSDNDLVIGTSGASSSLIFHAGGTSSTNSVGYFDQYGWTFNRQIVVSDHKAGPLVFTNQNTSGSSGASSIYQGQNDNNSYFQLGILSSNNGGLGPKWGPSDIFLTSNGSGNTLHIGGQTHLNFYADYHNSNTGIPALAIDRDNQSSTFDGNVLPYVGSEYNIGSSTSTWNTLYVNNVSYAPTTPSDWSGTPPTTIQQAIDRLAAAVKSLSGTGA